MLIKNDKFRGCEDIKVNYVTNNPNNANILRKLEFHDKNQITNTVKSTLGLLLALGSTNPMLGSPRVIKHIEKEYNVMVVGRRGGEVPR